MRYLRMLTNAVAGGVLVAAYLAVLVLQLNPADAAGVDDGPAVDRRGDGVLHALPQRRPVLPVARGREIMAGRAAAAGAG